jgi:hypothetical protein
MKKHQCNDMITSETPFEVRCVEEMSVLNSSPSTVAEKTVLHCSVVGGERMGLLMELSTAIAGLGLSIGWYHRHIHCLFFVFFLNYFRF